MIRSSLVLLIVLLLSMGCQTPASSDKGTPESGAGADSETGQPGANAEPTPPSTVEPEAVDLARVHEELLIFAKELYRQTNAGDLEALRSHVRPASRFDGCGDPGVGVAFDALSTDPTVFAVFEVRASAAPAGCDADATGEVVLVGRTDQDQVMQLRETVVWADDNWWLLDDTLAIRSVDCATEAAVCDFVLEKSNEIHAY